MIRKAFVMQVNPDAHEEYQRRHNPIWPELEAVLKSHGAHNYAIYLDKARNLLFATVEINSVTKRFYHRLTPVPANPAAARKNALYWIWFRCRRAAR
ncbi:L-rhamnose mutarotase [Escherichia coli]|nr:L-rhamnose mutarotase [Escherichia coli]